MATEESSPKAGIELDALVALRVMDIKRLHYPGYAGDGKKVPYYIPSGSSWATHAMTSVPLPKYSTEIAAAWLVVDKMRGRWATNGSAAAAGVFRLEQDDEGGFRVALGEGPDSAERSVTAPSAPEAICRAALEVVGEPTDA